MGRRPYRAFGAFWVTSVAGSLVTASCGGNASAPLAPDAGGDSPAPARSNPDATSEAATGMPAGATTLDGSTPESAAGGQSDGPGAAPTSDAYVSATLGPHADSSGLNLCLFGNPKLELMIGASGGGRAVDGSIQSGAGVHLSCTVSTGFHVNLLASLGGTSGGTLSIVGNVDSSSGGTGMAADLIGTDGEFVQSDCILTYRFGNQPIPVQPPVAPGRIWAHLSCPAMVNTSGKVVPLANGAVVSETCDGEVDFVFENCGW